jgi:non-heme chloroperoxidase
MPFVRIEHDERLHYIDLGHGPACVLLHGFGMQAAHYIPFILPLARSHRFILIDMRGFGGSRRLRLRDPDLLLSHALDLEDALHALHLERPALGGISMGAATSLAYLRLFGLDRFRAYLHIDQSPRVINDATYTDGVFGPDQSGILASWAALGRELGTFARDTPFAALPATLRRTLKRKLAEFASYAFHGRLWRASSALVQLEALGRRFVDPDSWPLYLDAMTSYQERDYDFRPSLKRIGIPMHIFVGMESRMYPPAGQLAMREHVPHARVVRFERAGHAVPAEAPLRFTRALGAFLRDSLS